MKSPALYQQKFSHATIQNKNFFAAWRSPGEVKTSPGRTAAAANVPRAKAPVAQAPAASSN